MSLLFLINSPTSHRIPLRFQVKAWPVAPTVSKKGDQRFNAVARYSSALISGNGTGSATKVFLFFPLENRNGALQLCAQPSVYYCSCQNPPIPCCHTCSYTHHEAPGTHNWSAFEQPEKKNISCQACKANAAELVCCCDFPLTFLCMQCRSEHTQKDRLAMHLGQPLEMAEMIKSLGDIERARRVLENKGRIEKYLNLNKTAASKLRDEVTILADALIARIQTAKEETLKDLSKVEKKIEEKRRKLKQEVEWHLFDAEVRCSDELAREAFETSRQFICADILSGEPCREGKFESGLAQLHIPPFLKGDEGQLFQVARMPTINIAKETIIIQNGETCLTTGWVPLIVIQPKGKIVYSVPVRSFEVTQEMMDAVHMPCREDFHSRSPEIPTTIGRHRLPIESLQAEFLQNDLIAQAFRLIGTEYSSWRRNRRDGNSYCRCVGILLLEHFCRSETSLVQFGSIFLSIVGQITPFLLELELDVERMRQWMLLLQELYQTRTRGQNAFQNLQYFLQNSEIDKTIIIAMRTYIAQYTSYPDISALLVEDKLAVIREILEYGKEAKTAIFKITALLFNIVLNITTVDNVSGQVSKTTYGPNVRDFYPSMHLLRLSDHFIILTPRGWDITDGYNFATNTYTAVSTTRDGQGYAPDIVY